MYILPSDGVKPESLQRINDRDSTQVTTDKNDINFTDSYILQRFLLASDFTEKYMVPFRALRKEFAEILSVPRILEDRSLSGLWISEMMRDLVDAINSGGGIEMGSVFAAAQKQVLGMVISFPIFVIS